MDEREIETPHEGCLERACECVQDEMASLRRLNQVLAPRYPIVNVPVDVLDAISKRAEDAEAALDRVRDTRGDDENFRCTRCGAESRGHQPEGDPRNYCGYPDAPEGCPLSWSAARDGTVPLDPPLSERERKAIEAMRTAVKIVGDGEEPVPYDIRGMAAEVVRLRAEVERLSSRDGTVAVEDVAKFVRDTSDHPRRGEAMAKAILAEFSRSSSGRPEQPSPDSLGSIPPSQPKEDNK